MAELRLDYDQDVLAEADAGPDPWLLFSRWFEDARAAALIEANAMALATADSTGRPAVRMVLLKDFDVRGFVFFTNYESRKAMELALNPRAALLFWWDRLHRQVRAEGKVVTIAAEESDAYFATRPHGSRIAAWASPQSAVIETRAELEARERHYRALYPEDQPVPRPPHWGGYRLESEAIEFWQGRRSRLHDRLRYDFSGEGWRMQRLAP